jgi:hypothetical protein
MEWRVLWRWDLVCHGNEFPVLVAPVVLGHPALLVLLVEESKVLVHHGDLLLSAWPDLVFDEALDPVGPAAAVESILGEV